MIEAALVEPIENQVKEILLSFDFKKSVDENVKALCESYTGEELKKSVAYITENYKNSHPIIVQKLGKGTNYRTKPQLAMNIKSFINGILPLKCNTCDALYCHTVLQNTQENDTLCLMCCRFSHKGCQPEKEELRKGTFHVCSICVNSIDDRKSKPKEEKKESSHEQLNLSAVERRSSVSSDSTPNSQEDGPKDDEEEERVKQRSEEDICPLYLESKCPHGMRGVNCKYEHPKRCKYYTAYGTEYGRGCRRGKECWFFHPKLCQNSVKMGVCLNRSCTDVHLKDTRRKPNQRKQPRESFSDHRSNRFNSNNNFRSQDSDDWRQPNRNTQTPQPKPWSRESDGEQNTENSSSNKDFLAKCLEKMKADVRSEMETQQSMISQQITMGIQQAFSMFQQQRIVPVPQQMLYQRQPPA